MTFGQFPIIRDPEINLPPPAQPLRAPALGDTCDPEQTMHLPSQVPKRFMDSPQGWSVLGGPGACGQGRWSPRAEKGLWSHQQRQGNSSDPEPAGGLCKRKNETKGRAPGFPPALVTPPRSKPPWPLTWTPQLFPPLVPPPHPCPLHSLSTCDPSQVTDSTPPGTAYHLQDKIHMPGPDLRP